MGPLEIGTLYTYGYLSGALSELEAFAAGGALILDIRINPTSRNPVWRQGHLRRALGAAYDWCPELGNPLYRNRPSVTLADEEAGMAMLEGLFGDRPVVLLCACRNWNTCHRRLAVEAFVRRRPGTRVVHLQPR